jgi:hypothetical protein
MLECRSLLTTFTVNSFADDNVGVGDSGDLRYVINRANADNTGTPNVRNGREITSVFCPS